MSRRIAKYCRRGNMRAALWYYAADANRRARWWLSRNFFSAHDAR